MLKIGEFSKLSMICAKKIPPEGKTFRRIFSLWNLLCDVRKQSNLSGAFDRFGQLSLVHRAGAGHAAGKDLSSLADELAEFRGVLVVDRRALVCAELADLFAGSSVVSVIRSLGSFGSLRGCFRFSGSLLSRCGFFGNDFFGRSLDNFFILVIHNRLISFLGGAFDAPS